MAKLLEPLQQIIQNAENNPDQVNATFEKFRQHLDSNLFTKRAHSAVKDYWAAVAALGAQNPSDDFTAVFNDPKDPNKIILSLDLDYGH
jgi:hypothetical protein